MTKTRLASDRDLALIQQHAIHEDLPEPRWDSSTAQIIDNGVSRWRNPSSENQALIDEWIRVWSHSRAENSTNMYRHCLCNYFAFCEDTQSEWTNIIALRDFIYGLAYPRIRYLLKQRRARTKKPLPRGQQPGVSWNTIRQYVASIVKAWATQGVERPTAYGVWRDWMDGLHRHLAAPVDQKSGLLLQDLQDALSVIDGQDRGLVALRDRALLLIGWHGALRISELASLEVEDLHRGPGGWLLHIAQSKTDQFAAGNDKPLWETDDQTLCPVSAWHEWTAAAGLGTGPLFRAFTKHGTLRKGAMSSASIRTILSKYVNVRNWGGHSMRIGYVTQARLAGASTEEIMVVTTHKDRKMVDHYAQQVDAHRQGPGSVI